MLKRFRGPNNLLTQAVWAALVKVIGAVAALILSLIISRQLGLEQSGYYFLAFSLVSVLAALSRFGLDNTVLRFSAQLHQLKDRQAIIELLHRALALSCLIALALCCLMVLAADGIANWVFSKPELAPVLRAMSFAVVGIAGFSLCAMALQGLSRIGASVYSLNIAMPMLLSILIVLGAWHFAWQAAWCLSLAALIAGLHSYLLWRRALPKTNSPSSSPIAWSKIFASCIPLWVVMLMNQSSQWSGQLVAGAWVDAGEIALLAVSQRIALLSALVLMAANLVLAPKFSVLYQQRNYVELQRLCRIGVRAMLLVATPICIFMLVFPHWLLGLFGQSFVEGAALLQVLAVAQLLNVATGSVSLLLSMCGYERELRNTVLISGPMALVLSLILVPSFGVMGSALATAIAITSQNLLAVYWVKRRLGFNTLKIW
ncbi:hypothetical protein DBZ36_19380 [Alginatibacterium sediminis]|uniref:Uncharacterized protein n=1 Tax=Alginatibacterium sediminis TaxID=2164068 RepID=A0A420E5T0_9ALTE|nr:oligosaccharide flippase family protein [Alginatibacterium sediminis]RKF13222.1 hypothetical protein DBZ36_19380 [Alginatibacterium sediminis]